MDLQGLSNLTNVIVNVVTVIALLIAAGWAAWRYYGGRWHRTAVDFDVSFTSARLVGDHAVLLVQVMIRNVSRRRISAGSAVECTLEALLRDRTWIDSEEKLKAAFAAGVPWQPMKTNGQRPDLELEPDESVRFEFAFPYAVTAMQRLRPRLLSVLIRVRKPIARNLVECFVRTVDRLCRVAADGEARGGPEQTDQRRESPGMFWEERRMVPNSILLTSAELQTNIRS